MDSQRRSERLVTRTKLSLLTLTAGFALGLTGCTVVRQGEVGVQRTLGKYEDRTNRGGIEFFNPFVATVVKVPVRTVNLEVNSSLPTKEGVNVQAEISILYRAEPKKVPNLLRTVGRRFEKNLILPVFRSAVADVSSRFLAKDMHTGSRAEIEKEIRALMARTLQVRGVTVEAVLIKAIRLPPNLARAIEEKLEAEQRALRMQFVLNETEQEAERKRIEALGEQQAQKILAEGLTPSILRWKSIEAFLELAKSPNTKVIVSDGDMPDLQLGSPLPAGLESQVLTGGTN